MTRLPARRRAQPGRLADRESLRTLLRYDPAEPADLEEPEPPAEARLGTGVTIGLSMGLAILTMITVVAASLAEAASPTVAIPTLERLFASLTEVDGLVALHAPDLQAQVEAGAPTLQLPGFVIEAPVPIEDSRTPEGALDPARFRTALLATVAVGTYEGSLDGGQPHDPVLAGATWALTATRYQQALGVTIALAVASTMLAALLLWWRGSGAWLAIGLAVALGGGGTVAAVAGASALLEGGATTANSLLRDEIEVVGALLEVPARNAVITTCLGGAFATIGLARALVRR